ncbi:MAG: hypothetical protein O3B86_05885 [Planctomycetota bacterium]|nr:hypothetical protein [Planctomycetota bacterium]
MILRVFVSITSTVLAGVFTTKTCPPLIAIGEVCGLTNVGCPTGNGLRGVSP